MLESLDHYKQYYAVNDPNTFACLEELENIMDSLVLRELAVAALRQAIV